MGRSEGKEGKTRLDIDFFEERRDEEKLTYEGLSAKSGVSVTTIWRITKGMEIRTENAERIANALRVSLESLIAGVDPPIPPKQTEVPRYEITIRIGVDYQDMTYERQQEIEILLSKVIGASSKPRIMDVKEGSAIVGLEMTRGDILRLLGAMVDHELGLLRIKAVKLNDYTWLKIMLAMLEVDNGEWKDLNRSALGDYIWSRPFSSLKIKTKDCRFCKGME